MNKCISCLYSWLLFSPWNRGLEKSALQPRKLAKTWGRERAEVFLRYGYSPYRRRGCRAAEWRGWKMIICDLAGRSWWPLSQPHLFFFPSPCGQTPQEPVLPPPSRAAVHVSPAKSAYSALEHPTHHRAKKAWGNAAASSTPVRYEGAGGIKKKKGEKNLGW